MTGFTPGPWRVEPCTHTVWGPAPKDDTWTWGNPVCEAKTTDRRFGKRISPDEASANARLISAAPELFDALGRLHTVCEMTTFSDQYPVECEWASAALAKAKGETQ